MAGHQAFVLKACERKGFKNPMGKEERIYRCPFCKGWHLIGQQHRKDKGYEGDSGGSCDKTT